MAPPIYVKGGVWTNVEDQILKAAVSKYGLTQWARVASLLPKKTAKQAKARWNEYLNPSIRNNEWEKHDDAKLLDLAKLLPNQWRSVAQIMGRTATQCVERYQKLLDAAVNNGASDDDEHAENVDLTGPGIEALPALGNAFESLPSRPDAEDMDEDEREMLSEAKARLANTQGKKAKRKDRERLLDESRRIALLQKRRELKAAGINVSLTSKNKARRKEFDYNADIPHERVPLPGKYDVSAEEVSNVESHSAFQKQVSVKGLGEGVPKKEKERVSRTSIKSAAGLVTGLDEHQNKRRKLHLPLPGAADEASEIDSHILQVSRELSQKEPVPVTGDVQLQPKKPVSRKKAVTQLKKLLSQMPEPTQQKSVPLQTELTVQSEPIANNNSNTNALELLRQVDEQATQSQVMQQGLPIPSLDTFDVEEQDPIASQILHEARLLIKSDYDQQVSSLPSRVQPLDSKVWEKAEAMVEEEIEKKHSSQEKRKSLHEKVQELVDSQKLPESPQTIGTIYQILNDLNASAHDSDTQISRSLALMDNAQTFAEVCQKIQRNSEQLHNYTSELNVTKSIAQDEEITIQTRSAMLSDLVDSVRAAENRVKTGVYSK